MTFLGVETSPVPSVVSEQLGLAKGFGLVVDYVVPNSPAATAGIQQNDILKMLNDQILIEPGQLRKLLQTFSEGTDVTLTILRKGQEQKVTVKVTKKEVPQHHSWNHGDKHEWHWDFDEMGDLGEQMQDLKGQLREQVDEAQHGVIRETVLKAREAARRAREDAHRAAREIRILSNDNGALKATKIDLGKAQIVFSDDKGEMKLETVDGKTASLHTSLTQWKNRFRFDMPKYVEFYLDGRLRLDEMISSRLPISEINTAFDRMRKGEAARQVIVFD